MIRIGNYLINKGCIEFVYIEDNKVILNLKSGEIIKEYATPEYLNKIIEVLNGLDIKQI